MTARDPALSRIAEKVERGERLTRDDALALFHSTDLLTIGRLADQANRRRNGDRVCFAANQHINPTNVCVLRNTCVFCSFARMPQEDGAYTRSLDEVFAEADAARDNPTREFHIVGGLHPKLRLAYYVDMFRGLKARHPTVHIKALTAVEIAHLARIEKQSVTEVLIALKEAGVTSLPGGGAEVFSPAARATIADKKLTGEEWLAVHRAAHRLGLPSNCTMLYGHVETMADRVDHLLALRALQDGRLPHLYPARLPPRPQRAGRGARPDRNRDVGLRRPEEHRRGSPGARQHPACEDPLAHGDALHLAGGAHLRVRRPRRHGGVRARVPRGGRGDAHVAVVRSDRRADSGGGEGAGRA